MLELWASNNRLAGHFLPFMITSTSDNFGYLIDIVDDKGRHPVAYYSDLNDESVYIIGSSFRNFMETFLMDVEETLDNGEDLIININKVGWPIDIDHWLVNDVVLRNNRSTIHQSMKKYMPDTKFFQLKFHQADTMDKIERRYDKLLISKFNPKKVLWRGRRHPYSGS